MKSESNQTQGATLDQEVEEIWGVMTGHEKRTMEFGLYPASLVSDAATKCGCSIEDVIDCLGRRSKQALAAA